jgi:hypothetical protein
MAPPLPEDEPPEPDEEPPDPEDDAAALEDPEALDDVATVVEEDWLPSVGEGADESDPHAARAMKQTLMNETCRIIPLLLARFCELAMDS